MNAQSVKGPLARELLVGLHAEVVRVAALGEAPLEADKVVRVVFADQGGLDDGVEGLDHVLPDGGTLAGFQLLRGVLERGGGGRLAGQSLRGDMIRFQHGELVVGHAERGPQELLVADDEVGEQTRHEIWTDFLTPDLALLVKGLGLDEVLDVIAESEERGKNAHDLDGVSRATGLVESAGAPLGEDVGIVEPELVRPRGHVGRQSGDEQRAEVGVFAFAKDLPEVSVGEGGVGSDLQLEQVVLVGVEVYGVNASRRLEGVRQDVISGGRDGQDNILRAKFQKALVNTGILPGEGVDVLILELGVLLQLVVVVDAPVVVLVEEGRQREVC